MLKINDLFWKFRYCLGKIGGENCKQMANIKRMAKRVDFERIMDSVALAVDGTWSVRGRLLDISTTGAKFHVLEPTNDRMRSEEFFLVMTADGRVKRRAKLIWEKKSRLGLGFVFARND